MDAYQRTLALTDELKTDDNVSPRIELPIQSTNTTGTYLEHLNEDCLLEIFSSNSLTMMDLCSLAETCARFKEITQRVFPKDYGIVHGYPGYEFRSKNGTKFKANLQDIKRTLKNFGSHLAKLKFNRRDQNLVNLVEMYCGDVTLNHLELYCAGNIAGVKTHMNSIFQRLRKLYVYYCDFDENVTSLDCDSLIELTIGYSSGCVGILKQTFPTLERFAWHGSHEHTKESTHPTQLYKFIRRHGQLKTIGVCDRWVCRSGLLHVIDSTCKELEELNMRELIGRKPSSDFSNQGGLSKLKILELDFDYEMNRQDIALWQAVKSLETIKLSIWDGWPNQSQVRNTWEFLETFDPINAVPWTMLTQLRKVYMEGAAYKLNSAGVLNMVRELINLEELECKYYLGNFYACNYLSKEYYTQIIKIVERREHVLTLKCYFDFESEEKCDENQKVKLIKKSFK